MRRTPLPARKKPITRHRAPKAKRPAKRLPGAIPRKSARDFLTPLGSFPKQNLLRSETYLELVRAMVCSNDRRPHHGDLPWIGALREGLRQSDPHHHPARGSTGGGCDLLTTPLCRECHTLATDGQLRLNPAEWVAFTLWHVITAIFEGKLSPAILVQIAEECNR